MTTATLNKYPLIGEVWPKEDRAEKIGTCPWLMATCSTCMYCREPDDAWETGDYYSRCVYVTKAELEAVTASTSELLEKENHAKEHEEFEKFLVMMDDLDQKIKSAEPNELKAKIALAEAGKMEAALAPSFPVTIELIPVLYQVFLKAANRYKAAIDFMTGVESDACEN